jgi:hypothetical protein
MSSMNRRPYLTATLLNQALLDACADNFETKIEMIVDIELPDGTYIRASDRNKYVGGTFYEARLNFPVIRRTLGEWLSPTLEFSTVELELSNADQKFNIYLPGGELYDSFIGSELTVSIGLSEQAGTYMPIFHGVITETGGVSRSTVSISFLARDTYEKFNVTFPRQVLTRTGFEDLEEGYIGRTLPIIYGDWTISLDPDPACIPAIAVNGGSVSVNGGKDEPYNTDRLPIRFVISQNALAFFDKSQVYLKSGDNYLKVPEADVTIETENRFFTVKQKGFNVGEDPYLYSEGDEFFVRVRGKDLGTLSNNVVAQAKDILIAEAGALPAEFHSNWLQYQSKLQGVKARVYADEPTPVIEYVLSLLEQVRLEAFIDNGLKIKMNALHFDEFQAAPSFRVTNWDVVEGSLKPKIDANNNFNRAQASFDYRPNRGEQSRMTRIARNSKAILQSDKQISKRIEYPNLYIEADVETQLRETLKISSATFETVDVDLTWRALLLDVGDFVMLDVAIGGILYERTPAMIRAKGYDPEGIKIPMSLWVFQLLPFEGYVPGYAGTVGGFNADITFET